MQRPLDIIMQLFMRQPAYFRLVMLTPHRVACSALPLVTPAGARHHALVISEPWRDHMICSSDHTCRCSHCRSNSW